MENTCLACDHPVKGRSDKKFCDYGCRNNYNNRLKSEDIALVKIINGILQKNRSILAKLNPDGKAKVTRKRLTTAQFNFDYHTHTYVTKNNTNYFFCYEYGYLILANDEVLLVKREEK